MEQLSAISILIVSFPEAIIMTLLGILAVGKFSYLENKLNLFKIVFMSAVIALSSNFVRGKTGSEIESALINLFIFSLMYIFILRFKSYESIMAALLSAFVIAVIQNSAVTGISAISGISLNDVFKNDLEFFLFVLPERILEITLIYSSLRFNLKIIDMDSTSIKKKEYYIQMIVYIISICTLIFLSYFTIKMLLSDGNLMNSTNNLLLRLNVYLAMFVTIVLTMAIRNVNEYYKNKTVLNNNEIMQSLDYITTLINEKDLQEARQAIDSLKVHITSNR